MSELLKKMGWSQSFFAERMGVSTKTVGRWCNGKPDSCAMKYLELVSKLITE